MRLYIAHDLGMNIALVFEFPQILLLVVILVFHTVLGTEYSPTKYGRNTGYNT